MDRDERREWRDRRWRGRSFSHGMIVGALIVLAGILLLLQNLNLPGIYDLWRFWPVALIVIGLARLTDSRRPSALLWSAILIFAGAGLLLDTLDIVHINFGRFIWPFVVILFGVSMLVRSLERRAGNPGGLPVTKPKGGDLSHFAVFGGGKRRVDSPDFKGGDLFAFFGGVDLDLRYCAIPAGGEAVIESNAIFGGIDLTIPSTWRVDVRGVGIFGGFEDKTLPPRDPLPDNAPRLVVSGYAIFGGVSVKN